jgi:hypothetical protein
MRSGQPMASVLFMTAISLIKITTERHSILYVPGSGIIFGSVAAAWLLCAILSLLSQTESIFPGSAFLFGSEK